MYALPVPWSPAGPTWPSSRGRPHVAVLLKDLGSREGRTNAARERASGYSAYEKLSPEFRKIIDGRHAIYRSAHSYLDRDDPNAGPKYIERSHPLVRVHPVTGWKSLFVNRAMTKRIVGLDEGESDAILQYLYKVYESNVDIQVRFRWTPGSSALWDNR